MLFFVRTALVTAMGVALVSAPPPAYGGPLRTWGYEPPSAPAVSENEQERAPPPPPPPPVARATKVWPPTKGGAREGEGITAQAPGLRYVLEGIEVRGNTTTLARVIMRFVPFQRGQALDVEDKELTLTRFRLLGTGFFRDVRLSLRRGSSRGFVVLVVDVVERNTIVINDLWLGLSADAEPSGRARPLTAFGGIDVSEQNLAGSGVALGGALVLAEGQSGLRTRVSDLSFLRSSFTTELQLLYNNAKDFFGNRDALVEDPSQRAAQDFAVVAYERFGGKLGVGHELGSVATRAFIDYRLEKVDARLPRAASHKRGLDIEPIDFDLPDGSTVLSTISATIVHDTRDQPFLPTKGWHLIGLVEASMTPLGSDYPYVKLVARGSRWLPAFADHVLRIEGIVGSVFGDAPLFEKFYVGDYTDLRPHRALDLAFDRRAAPNFFGTSIAEVRYADYAARASAEYRVPIYRGHQSVYGVDLFASLGLYALASARDITTPARGYVGLQNLPFDLTFNAGLRMDTAAGGMAFGIANVLGFVPIRSEGQ